MNISPRQYQALLDDIGRLRDQVSALALIVGTRATQRERDPSIDGFCRRNGISRRTYEYMRRDGLGPAEVAASGGRKGRIIITEEAEAAWLREREAAATARATKRHSSAAAPAP